MVLKELASPISNPNVSLYPPSRYFCDMVNNGIGKTVEISGDSWRIDSVNLDPVEIEEELHWKLIVKALPIKSDEAW